MKRSFTLILFSATLLGVFALAQMKSSAKVGKPVTFSKDVAPILNAKCAECHRPGDSAPFSTLTYKDVRPWAKSIKEKVVNRTMPPWHADPHYGQFKNDRSLSQKEIDTIVAWVDQGAKEGNPKDLPPSPKFNDGWTIGTPDMIIKVPKYTYKAGNDEYQYFDVATNFTEDKYVQFAEARPGNRKIVHHIIAFIQPPGGNNLVGLSDEERNKRMEVMLKNPNSPFYRDGFLMRLKPEQPVMDDGCDPNRRGGGGGDNILTGYAPGHNADIFAPGTGRRVPAGSIIRFQMHYSNQTLGSNAVEEDESMIGLIFAKEPPKHLVSTNSIGNILFKIPAGAENHKVTACRTVKRDTIVYALMPHMHLRGKSMKYEAFYPDGKSEVLLNVPKWDFAWQTNYLLKEPKRLPAGTRLMVTAYFDNSKNNKFNPDPTKDVRYGEPTYDEMMLGFMDSVTEFPTVAQIDPKILDSYTGKYEVLPNVFAQVTRDGNSLVVNTMMGKFTFLPQSETKFFQKNGDADLTFVKSGEGEISQAVIDGLMGRVIQAKRVKDAPTSAGGGGQ
ncbi:MAG TPA: DUF3471 domain-containing protein [Blastocatellia bacterium]|nr:DUF3471 domain-containing protein [Blastocatellia bacterium]